MDYSSPQPDIDQSASNESGIFKWCMQRITAIIIIPLTFWLIIFLNLVLNANHQETVAWLNNILNAVCLVSWVVLTAYHAALGLQVVFEDYISTVKIQAVAIRVSNLFFLLLGLSAVFVVILILQMD